MGLTSHLHTTILNRTHVLASTFNLYINCLLLFWRFKFQSSSLHCAHCLRVGHVELRCLVSFNFSRRICVICLPVINVRCIFPSVCSYKYHSCVLVSSQLLLTFVAPCISTASSSESLGEIESSTGSAVCPLVVVVMFQGDCLMSWILVLLVISAPKSLSYAYW